MLTKLDPYILEIEMVSGTKPPTYLLSECLFPREIQSKVRFSKAIIRNFFIFTIKSKLVTLDRRGTKHVINR